MFNPQKSSLKDDDDFSDDFFIFFLLSQESDGVAMHWTNPDSLSSCLVSKFYA